MTGRRERRRIATDQREQRRERIRTLLARVDRAAAGRTPITPAEAAALRALIEGEICHAETLRASAAGQQSTTAALRQQLAAAEEAIREVEADRDAATQQVTRNGACEG
ncbi:MULTISPECIES: hypothetical protein [unclassified Streptomyces]|uniref:hypothetical protein n=1 Tax=unclassified Streptomyces TaxID=2593676 RepID=UPI000379786A|nr:MULTISPECIES: hypothetical protein [unclassified Streptomyces]MYX36746.1 hypothetical protein [Streptomyces sp. SID8377]